MKENEKKSKNVRFLEVIDRIRAAWRHLAADDCGPNAGVNVMPDDLVAFHPGGTVSYDAETDSIVIGFHLNAQPVMIKELTVALHGLEGWSVERDPTYLDYRTGTVQLGRDAVRMLHAQLMSEIGSLPGRSQQ